MQVNRVNLGVFTNRSYQAPNVRQNYFSNNLDTVSFSGVKKIKDEKGRVVKEISKNYTIENKYKKDKLVSQRFDYGKEVREIQYGKYGQKVKESTIQDGKLVEAIEFLFTKDGQYRGIVHHKITDGKEITSKFITENNRSVSTVYENGKIKKQTVKDFQGEKTTLYNDDKSPSTEIIRYPDGKIVTKSYENGNLAVITEKETKKETDTAGRVVESTITKTVNLKDGNEVKVEVSEKVLSEPADEKFTEEEIAEFYRTYY